MGLDGVLGSYDNHFSLPSTSPLQDFQSLRPCPFLQWVPTKPKKSFCRPCLGHAPPSRHLRNLSACNVFLFSFPTDSSSSTPWAASPDPRPGLFPGPVGFPQSTTILVLLICLCDHQMSISLGHNALMVPSNPADIL